MAIPLERDEFLADLDPHSPREYAKLYQWERGGPALLPAALWDQHYRPKEAQPILRVVDEARAAGVDVKLQCDLAGLVELANVRPVVTLVAHWPLGLLRVSDVLDPGSFVRELAESTHPALQLLRQETLPESGAFAGALKRAADAPGAFNALQGLIRAVNAILWATDLGLGLGQQRWPLRGAERMHENRRILNDALSGVLEPPGGLELRDGSHTAEQVRDALPRHYNGLLELIVCHSIVLAETIKRARPHCQILANHTYARPLLRLFVYAEAIRLLRTQAADYLDVLTELRDRIAESGRTT